MSCLSFAYHWNTIVCSGDEDQAQERVNKLAKILRERDVSSGLKSAGVEVISCIIQRDEGRVPMRHSFHWSAEKLYYKEEPLLRHLEPPLSIYLELVCILLNFISSSYLCPILVYYYRCYFFSWTMS